jgi:NADH:ubiquinone oxidoreductase subunit 5 (subunit L)/multisubunit Na+/H+ antiporter MnhA subunit
MRGQKRGASVLDPASLVPFAVAVPFAAMALVLVLGRHADRVAGWLVLGAALASTAMLARIATTPGGPHRFDAPWMPALDVAWAFRADGYGLLLAGLVAGIGALVALYALGYLAHEDPLRVRRFWAALGAFMGAMLGIALADDLILLFVFWEITSVSSFILIGFYAEDEHAKAGAVTALQVTALGGLVMLIGILLVGQATGTFSLSGLAGDPVLVARLLDAQTAPTALVCILIGAFTKSAQVPFHFWLPKAMVAPTPVSTYLHAATMVKAGVFLLGRMHPIFGAAPLWAPIVVSVGAASMVLGAWQALREVDLKAILARTTGSALGMLTLLYGLGAVGEDSLHILNHALYKGALFLIAGIVEHHAHTRALPELGGLRRELPLAFGLCVLAAASMAGFPPLLGWVAKDSLYAELLRNTYLVERPLVHALMIGMALVTSACSVAVAGRLVVDVFLGARHRPSPHDDHAAQGGLPLWPSPLVLTAALVALGLLAAGGMPNALVAATTSASDPHPHVYLIPPVGWPLGASLLALMLGGVVFGVRHRVNALPKLPIPAASLTWDRCMHAIVAAGEAYSRRWQNGSLRWYLAATALTTTLVAFHALGLVGLSYRDVVVSFADLPWYGLLFCLLLAAATMTAVGARTRLGAAIATTTVGFLVSMLFVVYRSPDILLTQVLIETVSTIFVLLVLVFLPPFKARDLAPGRRLVNAAIAGTFGLTITLLLLLAMTPGLREPNNLSTQPGGLLSLSLTQGGGANAVNVIIVDIRAMDTNGEITVLVVVGLCVYGLLRSRRRTA